MNDGGFSKISLCLLTCLPVLIFVLSFVNHSSQAQQIITDIQMTGPWGQEIPDAVLLDNFEYSESPQKMGWIIPYVSHYGIYGYGLSYGSMQTVLDYEGGSRVLDVYRPLSVFLFNTPYNDLSTKKNASYLDIDGNVQAAIPYGYNLLSFKVRALGTDNIDASAYFNTFRFITEVKTTNNGYAEIQLIPQDKSTDECPLDLLETVEENVEAVSPDHRLPSVIEIYIGTEFMDCNWHLVEVDLNEAVKKYSAVDEEIYEILSVTIKGNRYRLDDIIFKKGEPSLHTFYQDADADGFGDPNAVSIDFNIPSGFVYNGNDCHDHDPDINPEANESCDGEDNDCDGEVDNLNEVCMVGQGACKRSGHMICTADGSKECDVLPGDPVDEVCDREDNDCDGEIDEVCLPPEIVCPDDIEVYIEKPFLEKGERIEVSYKATVLDYTDPDPRVIYDPKPGSGFPAGTTTVTVTATNASAIPDVMHFSRIYSLPA